MTGGLAHLCHSPDLFRFTLFSLQPVKGQIPLISPSPQKNVELRLVYGQPAVSMGKPPPDISYTDRIRAWAKAKAHGGSQPASRGSTHDPDLLPISSPQTFSSLQSQQATLTNSSNNATLTATSSPSDHQDGGVEGGSSGEKMSEGSGRAGETQSGSPAAPPPKAEEQGSHIGTGHAPETPPTNNSLWNRFYTTVKTILLARYINVLLVFVPVGIAVEFVPNMPPAVVFAMNAIAIIPLAGLLSYATEMVAVRLGDSLGALMNFTFGNAVELIIFIIALVKNQIRVLQASVLGSILVNLLLVLGMAFFLGGMRYREQLYNSTVTQMSACLLSLSVISLVLPTGFHMSFNDNDLADRQSLKISRGTSVVGCLIALRSKCEPLQLTYVQILLLVYAIYLLFQLKSHAYMYESTPQNVIDEEAAPGPVASWLENSSSDSGSSSDSDSDSSTHSRDTISKRMRRVVLRSGRRRKSSVVSADTVETADAPIAAPTPRTPSFGTAILDHDIDEIRPVEAHLRPSLPSTSSQADDLEQAIEDDHETKHRKHRKRYSIRHHRRHRKGTNSSEMIALEPREQTIAERPEIEPPVVLSPDSEPRHVDFAVPEPENPLAIKLTGDSALRRPFNGIRGLSLRPVAASLTPTVFAQAAELAPAPTVSAGPVPRIRYGIRRTNSLPDLREYRDRPPGAMLQSRVPIAALNSGKAALEAKVPPEYMMSRLTAILLLIVSTALVAVCAEFMVDSIRGLEDTTDLGEVFIGLIILPVVGNAAEFVTAVTVALKNKMDLAIGVAVGSSIQVALLLTPLVVVLGWILDRDMTLYFTLFETISLAVSAFMVNFLVLDGRSNYLEGALLCATFVIIGLVAFFYPNAEDATVMRM
jgi:Ca2+:H+ antiporter